MNGWNASEGSRHTPCAVRRVTPHRPCFARCPNARYLLRWVTAHGVCLLLCVALSLSPIPASAQTLVCEGVLGNSGEEGPSLVRMTAELDQRNMGMGVVCDRAGALWDRGGAEILNRYAPDGRLLSQYRLPKGNQPGDADLLTRVDDTLVLRLGPDKLYTLPIDAPPGSEVRPLAIRAKRLSFGSAAGRLAAVDGEGLFLLRVTDGAAERWAPLANVNVYHVEMAPDGAVYVQTRDEVRKFVAGREVTEGWPRSLQGKRWQVQYRLQLLGTSWFAHSHHGTIARFNAGLEPDPGVVLGGKSGSFIGQLEGNHEHGRGRGMARLGPDLYAVSGDSGVLHLLHWEADKQRFAIVRRIGALPVCRGLALDQNGDIRCGCGCWRWNDLPDTPIGLSDVRLIAGQTALVNERMVAPVVAYGRETEFLSLRIDSVPDKNDHGPSTAVIPSPAGAAYYRRDNRHVLLTIDAPGKGQATEIDAQGRFRRVIGPVSLEATSPIRQWTTLAMKDDRTLLAAGDGHVVELAPRGMDWKEQRRWNSWGTQPHERFGDRVFLTASDGRLWVADASRHRVLCFLLPNAKPVASFGQVDRPGDDLKTLNRPESIASRGDRAVVFDSANQRLMRLRCP